MDQWLARLVAGSPRSEDILKCQLRPISVPEYGGRLNAAPVSKAK